MKVLLFRDDEKIFAKSGVGRAMKHQEAALKLAGVDFTTDSSEDFDIIHLNTINPKSYLLAKKARKNGKKWFFMRTLLKRIFEIHLRFRILRHQLLKSGL